MYKDFRFISFLILVSLLLLLSKSLSFLKSLFPVILKMYYSDYSDLVSLFLVIFRFINGNAVLYFHVTAG